jgi:hypothetical protein
VGVTASVRAAAAEDEPPLWAAEARFGQGLSMGGGAGTSTYRLSPLTLAVLAERAIRTEPWTTLVGGFFVEAQGRAAVGLRGEFRIRPGGRFISRAGAGVVTMIAPYTLVGLSAMTGHCHGLASGMQACGDLEGVVFAFGSDLPEGRIAAQLNLVLGIRFDGW